MRSVKIERIKRLEGKMHSDLIYDVGANDGEDTAFYLAKGFRVIAVEANPKLVAELRSRFANEISSGLLVIADYAISNLDGGVDFHIHDTDDWSALEKSNRFWDGNFQTVRVPTIRFNDLVSQQGVPYYLKVDIEGGELSVFERIGELATLPAYVSFEDNVHTSEIMQIVKDVGYTRFKLIEQGSKPGQQEAPNPPREGKYVPFNFNGHMSGAFGEETPGPWLDAAGIDAAFQALADERARGIWQGWYDIHCGR
jgi:FkbM family methyltransferase